MFGRAAGHRMSFDRDAEGYRRGRPGYPEEVYRLLGSECGLVAGCRVLEVGAGSGLATEELVRRGARVTAVEPGGNFARMLGERFSGTAGGAAGGRGGVTVVNARLEDVELEEAGYELCVSATAWHWVDGRVALPKVAAALRPGGSLVVWWTVFGPTDEQAGAHLTGGRGSSGFREGLRPLYAKYLPKEVDDGSRPRAMRVEHWRAELQAGGWFGWPEVEVIRWEQVLTPESASALWGTFPNVAALPERRRRRFLAEVAGVVGELGGQVTDPRTTIVYHARRK